MCGHFLDQADGRRAAQDARRDAAAERRVGVDIMMLIGAESDHRGASKCAPRQRQRSGPTKSPGNRPASTPTISSAAVTIAAASAVTKGPDTAPAGPLFRRTAWLQVPTAVLESEARRVAVGWDFPFVVGSADRLEIAHQYAPRNPDRPIMSVRSSKAQLREVIGHLKIRFRWPLIFTLPETRHGS